MGISAPAWILKVNGRVVLRAVAMSEITEPVSAEDRKMIGQALAEYLANARAVTVAAPNPNDSNEDRN
jgi:hypothetical protein